MVHAICPRASRALPEFLRSDGEIKRESGRLRKLRKQFRRGHVLRMMILVVGPVVRYKISNNLILHLIYTLYLECSFLI